VVIKKWDDPPAPVTYRGTCSTASRWCYTCKKWVSFAEETLGFINGEAVCMTCHGTDVKFYKSIAPENYGKDFWEGYGNGYGGTPHYANMYCKNCKKKGSFYVSGVGKICQSCYRDINQGLLVV